MKVDSVGRILIPKELREKAGIAPGSTVAISFYGAALAPGRSGLPDLAEYQALQQRERDTASADLACRQEVDAEGERATILASPEEAFLEENRGQLDAMLDWFTVFG